MKKRISVFLLCMISLVCSAQTAGWHFYCPLDSVKTSGFYNIEITPELSSYLKTDYSDIRIVNDSGKWIPHLLNTQIETKAGFTQLPANILSKKNEDGITAVIIENKMSSLSSFTFLIKNTTAVRKCSISGSDDGKAWYVIKDSILLEPAPSADGKNTEYNFEFPSCNYKYFKASVDNKKNDPVNILSATTGVLLMYQYFQTVSNNPAAVSEQMDSGKVSCIKVIQKRNYHFDNIQLFFSGTKYFYRKIEIYTDPHEGFSPANPGIPSESFYISNKSDLNIDVPVSNSKQFYILIYNADNLPLKTDSVQTRYHRSSVTAYLEKGNSYGLILNNPDAVLPDYDLKDLNISLRDSTINNLGYGKIIALADKPGSVPTAHNNKLLLWSIIILTLALLLFFTSKMLRETNKRNNDNL